MLQNKTLFNAICMLQSKTLFNAICILQTKNIFQCHRYASKQNIIQCHMYASKTDNVYIFKIDYLKSLKNVNSSFTTFLRKTTIVFI